MNTNLIVFKAEKIFFTFLFLCISFMGFAQDSMTATTTTNSTATSSQTVWYMQPLAWVIGGVVLLLILIALFRNNSSTSDRVTVTKTVTRD